jgi:hypothetical protein
MPARPLTFDDLQQRFAQMAGVPPQSLAIGVTDSEVARYARVLEYGSVVGRRPWPSPGERTVLAVDPESGAQVVVTARAPQGFIRVQAAAFAERLRGGLTAPADWLDSQQVDALVAQAVRQASQAALERLRAAAPETSGRLAQSLEILGDDNSIRG